jgi:hypothetical protein
MNYQMILLFGMVETFFLQLIPLLLNVLVKEMEIHYGMQMQHLVFALSSFMHINNSQVLKDKFT